VDWAPTGGLPAKGQPCDRPGRDRWRLQRGTLRSDRGLGMSVRADEMRWQEERIRAKKTSRGCTSAREFRVIRQYRFVRGRFAGISPARRCTFRHLAATAVCPNVVKSNTSLPRKALIMPGSRVRVPPFPPIQSAC